SSNVPASNLVAQSQNIAVAIKLGTFFNAPNDQVSVKDLLLFAICHLPFAISDEIQHTKVFFIDYCSIVPFNYDFLCDEHPAI
ncbi:MAG: hypothetical protein AB1589_07670, partial [Cyanobacteriota bacterium]